MCQQPQRREFFTSFAPKEYSLEPLEHRLEHRALNVLMCSMLTRRKSCNDARTFEVWKLQTSELHVRWIFATTSHAKGREPERMIIVIDPRSRLPCGAKIEVDPRLHWNEAWPGALPGGVGDSSQHRCTLAAALNEWQTQVLSLESRGEAYSRDCVGKPSLVQP